MSGNPRIAEVFRAAAQRIRKTWPTRMWIGCARAHPRTGRPGACRAPSATSCGVSAAFHTGTRFSVVKARPRKSHTWRTVDIPDECRGYSNGERPRPRLAAVCGAGLPRVTTRHARVTVLRQCASCRASPTFASRRTSAAPSTSAVLRHELRLFLGELVFHIDGERRYAIGHAQHARCAPARSGADPAAP